MRITVLPLLSAAALTLSACGGDSAEAPDIADQAGMQARSNVAQPESAAAARQPSGTQATTETPDPVVATVMGRDGTEIGSLVIHPRRQGVRLDLHVEDLTPGTHAVHFHQTADCTTPDFTSSGGHYDPAGARHGMPDADEDMRDQDHHAGDMRNQTADDNGMLDVQMVNQTVSVDGGRNPLLDDDGSALVIHARADDYESQPSGAAGERIACAPITA